MNVSLDRLAHLSLLGVCGSEGRSVEACLQQWQLRHHIHTCLSPTPFLFMRHAHAVHLQLFACANQTSLNAVTCIASYSTEKNEKESWPIGNQSGSPEEATANTDQ